MNTDRELTSLEKSVAEAITEGEGIVSSKIVETFVRKWEEVLYKEHGKDNAPFIAAGAIIIAFSHAAAEAAYNVGMTYDELIQQMRRHAATAFERHLEREEEETHD